MPYIESMDIVFLDIAERGLIDESMIDPCIVESNFGKTHFLGIGKAPKKVLSHTDDLLQKFSPEKWRRQSTQLIRVEVKMCPESIHLIEIEQRPCGLGIFIEACKRFSVPVDIGSALHEVTVLHSAGRMKGEVFTSDEHLFTDNIFQWDKPRDVSQIIIRSREDEKIPHWLNSVFYGDTKPKMFLLRRNADKIATYKNLDVPHRIFPTQLEDSRIAFPAYVKQTLIRTLQDFRCRRCVLKPRRGSRAREVAVLSPTSIYNLNEKSGIVKSVQESPESYVLQPYYRGVHETKNVCHLYRLFYRKTKHGWQHVGGFLTLDNIRESKMIVHRHERARNILIVP